MQATVYNLAGEEVEKIELDDAIFGISPTSRWSTRRCCASRPTPARAPTIPRPAPRSAAAARKPWRQKGTGRARQGSTRSPQWRHGGVVFGPHPRSYEQDMPRKMRRLAIRGVLSAKAADGQHRDRRQL